MGRLVCSVAIVLALISSPLSADTVPSVVDCSQLVPAGPGQASYADLIACSRKKREQLDQLRRAEQDRELEASSKLVNRPGFCGGRFV